jgi:DNA (cytosine-5)-methyltransferase 1
MKNRERISIDEFDGKRFQIRLVEPKADKKAVLTHYLHNIHNGVQSITKRMK